MPRVKRGVTAHARHKKVLNRAKGYFNARRKVFLSSTRLDGRYVLRICTVSFRTHADRVDDHG